MLSHTAAAIRCALVLPFAGIVSACGGSSPVNDDGTERGATLVIYGDISGLSGSGLVLQNNGAGDLTVSAPANSFLFERIREKSDYAITIKAQPTTPWQTCTVSAGAGRIVCGDDEAAGASTHGLYVGELRWPAPARTVCVSGG